MPRARTGPILVLVGGVLSAVGMIVGWSKITMSYGEIRGETVVGATPMAVFGACLLLIGGFFLFRRVTKRRTFAEGTAAIGGILVLASVVLQFTRSYGVEMIGVEQGPQSAEEVRAQLQELIAAGVAHLDVTWTIGLNITLAGGILGLVGALLAVRDRPNAAALPAIPTQPGPAFTGRVTSDGVAGVWEYGSGVDDWTPWEKLGLWIIFVAVGVLIVWLTFAFWPLSHGVQTRPPSMCFQVVEMLGHSSPAITAGIYQHTRRERKREAVDRVGAAIFR